MNISEELGFLANALVMTLDFEANTGLTDYTLRLEIDV